MNVMHRWLPAAFWKCAHGHQACVCCSRTRACTRGLGAGRKRKGREGRREGGITRV